MREAALVPPRGIAKPQSACVECLCPIKGGVMRRVGVSFAVAACWVLCLLAPAGADDSLPQNGKIDFSIFQVADSRYDIYAVNPDGSSLNRLSTIASSTYYAQSAWSPDGTKLAFVDEERIWVMDADGSNLRVLTLNKSDLSNFSD